MTEAQKLLLVNSALRELLLRHMSAAQIDVEPPSLVRHLEVMQIIGMAKARPVLMPPMALSQRLSALWAYLRGRTFTFSVK